MLRPPITITLTPEEIEAFSAFLLMLLESKNQAYVHQTNAWLKGPDGNNFLHDHAITFRRALAVDKGKTPVMISAIRGGFPRVFEVHRTPEPRMQAIAALVDEYSQARVLNDITDYMRNPIDGVDLGKSAGTTRSINRGGKGFGSRE